MTDHQANPPGSGFPKSRLIELRGTTGTQGDRNNKGEDFPAPVPIGLKKRVHDDSPRCHGWPERRFRGATPAGRCSVETTTPNGRPRPPRRLNPVLMPYNYQGTLPAVQQKPRSSSIFNSHHPACWLPVSLPGCSSKGRLAAGIVKKLFLESVDFKCFVYQVCHLASIFLAIPGLIHTISST